MPTYKHPCPHCGTFINRDVVACPKCGTRDPFAPGRCPACGAVIEDPSWVACPRCGKPVGAAAVAAAPPQVAPSEPVPAQTPPTPAAACSACGSPLAQGARFCLDCGTAVS